MNPKYSILLCNQSLAEYKSQISTYLHDGIKVFWFGSQDEADELKQEHEAFAKEFLLQAYAVDFFYAAVIVDGRDDDDFVALLEEECPMFNAAQYRVEHCTADEHIVVQASAGTGKTTVMIDRIVFLLHTVPDLRMSDMYMITFTNDATNQMNLRLQEMLMKRFRLTGRMRYFRWVEEQSQMNISTIHSFALTMMKAFGIGESFTGHLSIRNFGQERRDLIHELMDRRTHSGRSVKSQVGVRLYFANELVDGYWRTFAGQGISHRELDKMDWGSPEDETSEAFQRLLSTAVRELDDEYFKVKQQKDAISINDIMRDLQEILEGGNLPVPDMEMKYLFIDEFQDSDLSQIKVAVQMVRLFAAKLFVVGDVKQSIYRFRGATDQAFEILDRDLEEADISMPSKFILKNNYRTASNIMERMNDCFELWGDMGLLKYDGPVLPFNRSEGTMRLWLGTGKKDGDVRMAMEVVRDALEALKEKVERSGKEPKEKDRVVILTRTNTELKLLAASLRRERIPASVKRDGTFFKSEAVRDFYTMIGSYLFADEPKHIFNYLLTPFAGEIETMDVNQMEYLHGNYDRLVAYLGHYLKQTCWEKYYKELRLRPVMAVLHDMLSKEPVINHYIRNAKRRKLEQGWQESSCISAVRREAAQYQANLWKLMELLQNNLNGEKISLYDVYQYLQVQIATNRTASEPTVEFGDDYQTVLCMTVHKSKGLEFDTVIIPFTEKRFPANYGTELLIDPLTREVGWNCADKKRRVEMRNTLYMKLKHKEIARARAEETRILYVAMTRAINNLYCIVHPSDHPDCWGYLLEEAGVDYE